MGEWFEKASEPSCFTLQSKNHPDKSGVGFEVQGKYGIKCNDFPRNTCIGKT